MIIKANSAGFCLYGKGFKMLANTDLISSFGQFLKKIGKKDSTVQSYCRDTSQFLDFLISHQTPLSDVDLRILLHYRSSVQEKNRGGKSNSFRRAVIAIRLFYRLLPQFSLLPLGSLDKIPIPVREESPPRKLTNGNIEALLQKSNKGSTLKAARDKAIVSLFCFEGLKVSELINLEWKHFFTHQNKGTLLIPGERKRLIILNSKTNEILINYKKTVVESQDKLPKSYKMFLGFKGRKVLIIAPAISRHGLKFMLYELGEACKIPRLNTENLRHYAIQYQLDSGSSSEEIMIHFGLKRIGNISKHHRTKKDYDAKH
jgi:site-specific recombinase XerD